MTSTEILLDALNKIYKWNLPVGADHISLLYNFHSIRESAGDAIAAFYDAKKSEAKGEFTTYDTSRGNCGLCGKLGCNGRCFK